MSASSFGRRVVKQMRFYVVNAGGKREFMQLNGVKQLTAAMANLPEFAEIIQYSCHTLSALTMGPGAKDVRAKLVRMSVMEEEGLRVRPFAQ